MSFGSRDQAARDREHLLLTAGKEPALLIDPLTQPGKEIEGLFEARAPVVARDRHHAEAKVLQHGQIGQHTALFRHPRDAAPHDLVCRQPRDVVAAEGDPCPLGSRDAHDGPQRVVLPAPFRPISVTTSPSPTPTETPWRMCASP